jgi:membrane protein CcdC involved in cytochrome C biogenesis
MFNFYLLTFYLKYFPGNIYTNSVYIALSNLVAFALVGILLSYTSMKVTMRIGVLLGSVGGMLYLLLTEKDKLVPLMLCLARIGQSMIFNSMLISVNKIFPT